MVKMSTKYEGQKHCQLRHEPSNRIIETDAPKDNHGRGESFSPTDLVGAALTACMLTVMGINAEKDEVSLTNAHAEVIKEMSANPRRISKLAVKLHLPKSWNEETRKKYKEIALNCPVRLSLHQDIQVPVEFIFDV